jgi:hypothetical protein
MNLVVKFAGRRAGRRADINPGQVEVENFCIKVQTLSLHPCVYNQVTSSVMGKLKWQGIIPATMTV